MEINIINKKPIVKAKNWNTELEVSYTDDKSELDAKSKLNKIAFNKAIVHRERRYAIENKNGKLILKWYYKHPGILR